MFLTILLLLLFSQNVRALLPSRIHRQAFDSIFNWSMIEPSEKLVYHDCYSNITELDTRFKCARLWVPLDWHNSTNQNRIPLAVIKLDAKAHRTLDGQETEKDLIFWNPGGPGGSGVSALLVYGKTLQDVFDGENSFSIISWDPRGVGFSEHITCFDTAFKSQFWSYQQRLLENFDTTDESIALRWTSFQARAEACTNLRYNNSEDNLQDFLTTAYTARDMLEIFKQEKQILSKTEIKAQPLSHMSNGQELLNPEGKDIRLNYLGSSYGTFLGNTFASLYPQHVGKMVLDGNIDADGWISKWWTTNIIDFEAIWNVFFERCYLATTACSLWRPSDVGPEDIETRVRDALASITARPFHLSTGWPEILSLSDVTELAFHSFYSVTAFPMLASILNSIYGRNESDGAPFNGHGISCSGSNFLNFDSTDVFTGTFCGDADPSLAAANMSEFQEYLSVMKSQSPTAGARIATSRLACMMPDRISRIKGRFAGPFGTEPGMLQTPILFLNNRLDPVCPISSARRMAMKYPGSIVLEQDAVGHCALAASLGQCVKSHVQKYFNEGILPPRNTVCPPGCEAFDDECSQHPMHDLYTSWITQQRM